MEEENFFKNIEETFKNIPDNFNILEEQIDIKVQSEYFEYSRKIKKNKNVKEFLEFKDTLFEPIDIERKKEVLVSLASFVDVVAFRAIEKYYKSPDKELKDWAVLAFQESRMMLQSSLLEEQQVFISTGMGGKGSSLRYFVVFFNILYRSTLEEFQEKLLNNELKDIVEKNKGEIEELNFYNGYSTATILLPVKAVLKDVFTSLIDEVNQYGDFLNEDVIITNIKKLDKKEISKIIEERERSPKNDEDEES